MGQAIEQNVLDDKSGVQFTRHGTIQTNPHNYMTDRLGVFAGGDAQMGAKTIIECVGQGKLGARSIHAYLNGEDMKEVARRLELEEENKSTAPALVENRILPPDAIARESLNENQERGGLESTAGGNTAANAQGSHA